MKCPLSSSSDFTADPLTSVGALGGDVMGTLVFGGGQRLSDWRRILMNVKRILSVYYCAQGWL